MAFHKAVNVQIPFDHNGHGYGYGQAANQLTKKLRFHVHEDVWDVRCFFQFELIQNAMTAW